MNFPPLMHQDDRLYSVLRSAHTYLALLLFATVMVHLAGALFHALVRCDDVFPSMTGLKPTQRPNP